MYFQKDENGKVIKPQKREGIFIKNCEGSIDIPTQNAYQIEVSLEGSVTGPAPQYKTTYYKSSPEKVTFELTEKDTTGTENIINDCSLAITDVEPFPTNNTIALQRGEAITITTQLECEAGVMDVKPTRVSAYIDIPSLNNNSKEIVQCETKEIKGNEVYIKGTKYYLTCSKEQVEKALPKLDDNGNQIDKDDTR